MHYYDSFFFLLPFFFLKPGFRGQSFWEEPVTLVTLHITDRATVKQLVELHDFDGALQH